MQNIVSIRTSWDAPSLADHISRITKARSVQIRNRFYYPYYFVQYRLRGKMLFMRVNKRVGCTVDLVSGREALVDAPLEPCRETVPRDSVLEGNLTELNARERAKSYVYYAVSMKIKLLGSVELIQERELLYHRPFWLVTCEWPDEEPISIIVDGVSGRFHPLPDRESDYMFTNGTSDFS